MMRFRSIITRASASVLTMVGRGSHSGIILVTTICISLLSAASVRAQNLTLTINVAGPSTGTVAVIGNAGLCGTPPKQCTFQVPLGQAIRLVANGLPAQSPPGLFSGGTGSAAACGLSTCSFTMTTATEVTATFDPANGPTATVTTSLAGDGTGTVGVDNSRCQNFDPAQYNGCTTSYLQGSVVSLGASPAAGSRFTGYSAGTAGAAACGTASQCVFTLNANATVTGTFSAMTSIAVTPSTASKTVGQTQNFVANGTFSDGVTEQIPFGSMGTWRTRAPLPAVRFSLSAAVAGGKLYAIGGIAGVAGAGGPTNVVQAYDPVANTWSTLATMPSARAGLAAVTVNGFIFAIGGQVPGNTRTAAVERYDPSTNTWLARAPMSGPRGFLAAGAINGIIYAVGGDTIQGGPNLTTVEAYDPATNIWTTKASMATARSGLAVGVVNGILYAVGGAPGGGPSGGTVEAYDPATNTWSTKAPLPNSAGSAMAVAVADGVLYSIGGSGDGSSVVQYDVARNVWNIKSGMPTSRDELAAAAINGTIYAVGGLLVSNPPPNPNQSLTTVEAFTDHLQWSSSQPAIAAATQQGQANAIAVGSATIIASVGGLTCGANCATLTVTSSTPTVQTSAATSITPASATLNGTVNPNGISTTATFDYGLTSSYGGLATAAPVPGSGSSVVAVSATVTGLVCNTLYHFRATATNASGTPSGSDLTFTTTACTSVGERVILGLGPYATTGGWIASRTGADGSFGPANWALLPWSAYNATGGGVRIAAGDVDGDGLDEFVAGLGTGGGGWIAVFDDAAHGYALLRWIQVTWPSYNAANGEVWPAVGDVDGDGKAEIVAGLGAGGAGWFEIFDDAAANYGHVAWRQVAWSMYNASGSGATHPAIGNVDGAGTSEIILGLGSGSNGWLEVVSGSQAGYSHQSWLQVNWAGYDAANGTTFPAAGDLDGDGRAEIVAGLGAGGGGWLEVLEDASSSFAHAAWLRTSWADYNLSSSGETHPAVGNLDNDARAEIVVGLDQFSGGGGWFETLDDGTAGYASLGWRSVGWAAFSAAGGSTFPAIGRFR